MEQANRELGGGRKEKVFVAVGIVLTLFLAALTIKELKSIPYVGKQTPAVNTISVTGKGEVFAAPDIATFSFTVQNENLVVSKAQEQVTKTANSVLAFLKQNGVAEKDIKTTNYNIYPRYEYPGQYQPALYPVPGRQVLAAYVVSQSVEVKVRKISDAGRLVGGIGALGATDIGGLQFTVDDDEAVLAEARGKAIEDAKTKAKTLARQLGVSLVQIVNFSESGNYPIYYAKGMALGMGGATDSAPAPELPSGENQYLSNVSITYEIR